MELIPDIFENALWAALEWQEERHPPFTPGPNVLLLAPALYVDSPQVSGHPSSYEPFSLQLVTGAPQAQRCSQDLLEAYRRGLSCTVSVMWVVEQEYLGIGPSSKAKDMSGRQIFVTWLLWSPFALTQRTVLPRAQSI